MPVLPFQARLVVGLFLVGCSGQPAATTPDPNDATTPVAIDHPGAPATTYKGLPLRLAATGAPTVTPVDGVIGVVCIGMSNANQECDEWIAQLAAGWSAEVNPAVRLVNCAVGGHAIEKWIDPAFDAELWDACRDQKLGLAGVRPDQVRVIYHKAADQFGSAPGGVALPTFPAPGSDYEHFLANLTAFKTRLATEFPSVLAVYTSSRSYGGFTGHPDRGEPLSYEEGHALNSWLGMQATGTGPWYGWGAYIWAPACTSGMTNGTGTCYDRADYQGDGVHPSASGRLKISRLFHDRLLQDVWYRR